MQKLVSIIMPCFNGRETLTTALASLLCQSYENWELIFVDDGSTDDSAALVSSLGDPRFRVFRLECNYGRGAARRRCHEETRGQFVAMLDADDWWYSSKLEQQVRFLSDHPDVSLVGGALIVLNETGRPVGYRCGEHIEKRPWLTLAPPPLAYASLLMSRRIFDSFNYNPNLPVAEDLDLLQRVCLQEPFANLPEPVYVYTEYARHSWQRMQENFFYRIQSLRSFAQRFPWQSRKEILKTRGKYAIYLFAHLCGLDRRLLARRSTPLTEAMWRRHQQEERKLRKMRAEIMPAAEELENNEAHNTTLGGGA